MKMHSKKSNQQLAAFKKMLRAQRHYIVPLLASLGLIALLTVSTMSSSGDEGAGPQRLVTVYDQGVQRSVLTYANTVRNALNEARIDVSTQDVTEPSIDSALTESYVDVIIYRSRPVTIVDGAIRQTVMTVAQSPSELLQEAQLQPLAPDDNTSLEKGSLATNGAALLLVNRAEVKPIEPVRPAFVPNPNALTKSKGAHVFVDSSGVAHRETYYDLPMNIVIGLCGPGGSYTIRPEDGAKIDQDGYVLVAAGLSAYPRCSIVETSMGLGRVYDTGGFALRHPYGFDLATDWTNNDGR